MDYYPPLSIGTPTLVMGQAPYDPRRNSVYDQFPEFAGGTRFSSAQKGKDLSLPSTAQMSLATATMADSLVSISNRGTSEFLATRTIEEAVQKANSPFVPSTVSVAEIDSIARQRVKLMALKYADPKGVSAEIAARLEILDARIAQRAPRVTTAQLEVLERATELLAEFRPRSESRRARLNQLARV